MKKGFVYIAFLGLLAASCAKDLGNYNYHTLPSPTVTGIDTRIDARKKRAPATGAEHRGRRIRCKQLPFRMESHLRQ